MRWRKATTIAQRHMLIEADTLWYQYYAMLILSMTYQVSTTLLSWVHDISIRRIGDSFYIFSRSRHLWAPNHWFSVDTCGLWQNFPTVVPFGFLVNCSHNHIYNDSILVALIVLLDNETYAQLHMFDCLSVI